MLAWLTAAVLAATVAGLSVALAAGTTSTTPPAAAPGTTTTAPRGPFGGGGIARFGGQGVIGTVSSVGTGSFVVTDRSGQTVTVDEQSSTTYTEGASSSSASAVTTGVRVAALGTRTGNTVKATRVIILPAGGFGGFGGGPGGISGGTGSGTAS